LDREKIVAAMEKALRKARVPLEYEPDDPGFHSGARNVG
jgi:hypothetical protein